jgi:hypothetical protein
MNLKNAEGYLDPTAAIALANVARSVKAVKAYRPLVYIASPFAGDTEYNVARARCYCRFAVSRGCIPVAPHLLYPQFVDDSDRDERELGLFFALVLLDKCDELWVFGSTISAGMAAETRRAKRKNCRLRYFSDECEEVQDA